MTDFQRRSLRINGIDTVVLSAGRGPPLVYFHGAGTSTRFAFAEPWLRSFEVVIPYHPGFGESADDPEVTDVHDYVLHYLELFEALGLKQVRLVGQSMGGLIAAQLAVEHGYLVEKLALVCPLGVPVPDHPTVDFLAVAPPDLAALLVADPQTLIALSPAGPPSAAFLAERGKEAVTATRLGLRTQPFDPKLQRHLHRLKMPTMLVWGKQDRLTPFAQLETWKRALPRAEVRAYDRAGHLVLDEAPAAVTAIADFFA